MTESTAYWGDPGSAKLDRSKLGDRIVRALRTDILYGRLAANDPVSQEDVCARFGTSRMPARDAINRLKLEGLVGERPGGQSFVVPLTDAYLRDSFYIEAALHGRCAMHAAERASTREFDELTSLHEQMVEANAAGDHQLTSSLNRQWHYLINKYADATRLRAILGMVSLDFHGDFHQEIPGLAAHSDDEHAVILDAMRRRDAPATFDLMYGHVIEAGENMLRHLRVANAALAETDADTIDGADSPRPSVGLLSGHASGQ